MDKGFLKRGPLRFCLLILAPVLTFALTTARTALAGPLVVLAEGGTTDSFGDSGHRVIGGLSVTRGGTTSKLNLTIAYEDNFNGEGAPLNSFVCTLTNAGDLVFSGGVPVQSAVLTISASAGDKCVQTISGSVFITNVNKSLSFRTYTIGNKTRIVSTGSTLVDHSGDIVGNVAIAGELEPSGSGSNQAGGNRLISGSGGAVDVDDSGRPSGHMALAGVIRLNPLKKGVPVGTAKSLDVTIDYEDSAFPNHLVCHLINPADVSYTLVGGVGTLTLTIGSAGECDTANTGKLIKFDLYVGGSSGRIVSTSSTLIDNDLDVIEAPAVVGEISTPGGT